MEGPQHILKHFAVDDREGTVQLGRPLAVEAGTSANYLFDFTTVCDIESVCI